ncbi:hypothetical protein K491DRAFT_703468 [Lophiostoma macrostomum CBS 122681]|uniref:HPP transmembrane region domain-containing protein n=1 Tax=Lophiostoma macrostomum CBS 122681 TaxID=1314788 RepID=A0A6A6TBV0_9PLEO|nr:hypothetical protein K491DRAFT_703468 [Lophiostoma macrostomum CBS 122681]
MGLLDDSEAWNLDIDKYINSYIPASPLHHLPTSVSRFLGYRKQQRQDVGNILGAFWSMLGAFCGLAVIAAVFNNTESIQVHTPPALIASFGASAILEYNAIRSPLGQPRNALLGHTFSAIVGVSITKLFQLHFDFERIKWIAGAVSCGIASAVMLFTGTVHPPGGASAVLAATEPVITAMGYYFVGLVAFGTFLMLAVALILNNIQRQFPVYWWTALDLREARKQIPEEIPDAEGGLEKKMTEEEIEAKALEIQISAFNISLPEDVSLNLQEVEVLESLRDRLRKRHDEDLGRVPSSRPSTECTAVPSRTERSDSSTLGLYP